MNQQPDKFFRDKFHGYQKSVSPEAWNRISQNLGKKNRTGVWLKVAASLLLLATTAILLLDPDLKHNNSAATTETVAPPLADQPPVITQPAPLADAIQPEQKDNAHRKTPARVKHRMPDKNTSTSEEPVTAPIEEATQLPEITSTDVQPVELSQEEDRQLVASTEEKVVEPSGGVTIVFSAEEVNKKYLLKNDDVGATSGNKSSSTLQKLLDKAYDLKHNQDPLGGLRQKKDEILAMNFKNDKQRTQND